MNEKTNKQNNIIHVIFEIGLLLNGIHALMEVIGDVFLLFLSPDRLN